MSTPARYVSQHRKGSRTIRLPKKLRASPGSPQKTKSYTLNKGNALKKKLKSCDLQSKISYESKHGNHIYTFSTGLYEIYKHCIAQYYAAQENNIGYPHKVTSTDRTDTNGTVVETKIQARTKTTRHNSPLRYCIMLYHTQSKIMLNGKYAAVFFTEHEEIIKSCICHPELVRLDETLKNAIQQELENMSPYHETQEDSPRAGEDTTRPRRLRSQNLETIQGHTTSNCGEPTDAIEVSNGKTPKRTRQSTPQRRAIAESLEATSGNLDDSSLEEDINTKIEAGMLCPMCRTDTAEDTIECSKCTLWIHYYCEAMPHSAFMNITE